MEKYIIALCEMRGIVQNFINMPHFKSAFAYGIALYLIALFALLRGDIYYSGDDFYHSVVGFIDANRFSRYVATFMLDGVMPFGKGAMDMSPLPQILGVIFVVLSSMILLYLIRKKFDLLGILASLPLGLSPYFLQNFSYRFDSLTMSVALFLAVLPFLFKDNKRIFCYVSVLCLLLMFMCYQAANGIYIILSLYFAFSAHFLDGRNLKSSAGFLALCACNLIIASALFAMMFLNHSLDYIDSYASYQMIPLNSAFLLGVWGNLIEYLTTIFSDFKQTPYIWLILLNFALFVVNIAIRTNRPKITTIPSAIIFLVLGIVLSYGLYLVLQKPLFEPRVFYGFNALMAVISITNASIIKGVESNSPSAPPHLRFYERIAQILHYTSATIIIITAYFLISFANIYGNALKKQDEYLDFRAKLLARDLARAIPKSANAMVHLEIYTDNHPVTKRFIDKYGGISRIVPKVAEYDIYARLPHYNIYYDYNKEFCEIARSVSHSVLVAQNAWHRIEKAKVCYFVTMR